MSVTVTEGTQTAIKTTTDTGAEIQHVRADGGTVGVVSNLTNGTVRVSVGTVAGGTLSNLNFGTIDTFYRHPDRFATVISSGTSDVGTIKAAVSGSAIYVTDLIVSVGSASNVVIGDGGTSKPIAGSFFFNANGGAVINYVTPISTTAGSALVYKQSANGPITITCTGYVD